MNCAAFFPDGGRVLTASGGIRIGEELKEDPNRAEWTGTEAVTGGIIKEDVDRSMRIWDQSPPGSTIEPSLAEGSAGI